eukprot:TRINITY_DN9512_c0_g1_i1.p1 TRINITY_DN9512_c0_g1~~TRINITY_DN9512_c0_g1_i1.p1  ORF type:complete len:311 (-),score=58.48 TRINITY_DN9512_c0_g1_i1:228-1160(-)
MLTIEIILLKLETYYCDFDQNSQMLKGIELFARQLRSSFSERLLRIIQQCKDPTEEPTVLQFSRAAPYPEVPKKLFTAKLKIWDISELELARQITILDYQYFCKIRPREFFSGFDNKERAPNLCIMQERFRQVSKWVEAEIASRANTKHRARLVKTFISLAAHLLKLNNFNTLVALLIGVNQWALNSSSTNKIVSMVLHFSDVWPELSKRDRKDFDAMEQLMINQDLYEETLDHVPGPRIPYIDFHVNKIMDVEEHIPSIVGAVVNFSKSKYQYNLIAKLQQCQEANPYNLQPVQTIADLLLNTLFAPLK